MIIFIIIEKKATKRRLRGQHSEKIDFQWRCNLTLKVNLRICVTTPENQLTAQLARDDKVTD